MILREFAREDDRSRRLFGEDSSCRAEGKQEILPQIDAQHRQLRDGFVVRGNVSEAAELNDSRGFKSGGGSTTVSGKV